MRWPSCRRPVSRLRLRRRRRQELFDGQAPVRVGGNIKPPVKARDVKPVYPEIALNARVQGVVIIEATIDPLGNVAHGRILRGQPLLDQAALDAVKQWQFTPTLLNGVAVPVIMTRDGELHAG